jgi:hypothetical protein
LLGSLSRQTLWAKETMRIWLGDVLEVVTSRMGSLSVTSEMR